MKILQWIGITLAGLFALLLIAGMVLYFALKPYLGSDSFRKLVELEISKKLQVEVQLEPLQWNGLSLFTNSIKTVGPSKVTLKSLHAHQLRISIALRPLLEKIARIDLIELQSLEIEFQVAEPQPEPLRSNEPPPSPPPAWIQSIAPQKVEIGEISLQEGKLRWPAGENAMGQLSQFKVLASVDGNDLNLSIREGKLELPQFPILTLQTVKARTHQNTLFITTATLLYENEGTFTVDGELGLGTPMTSHLNFELASVPITPFLSGDWRARLLGKINGKFKLQQDEKTDGIPEVTGSVELIQGKIEALPLFNEIAKITQVERWKNVPLDRAKTNLRWTPQKITLDQIDFESKKLLLLQGNMVIEGENLAGTTTIGTDPGPLKIFPGLIEQVFNQTNGDYVTTPVVISGTKASPQEDLTERLAVAALTGLIQKLPPGVGEKVQEVTDEIQKKVPGIFDFLKK